MPTPRPRLLAFLMWIVLGLVAVGLGAPTQAAWAPIPQVVATMQTDGPTVSRADTALEVPCAAVECEESTDDAEVHTAPTPALLRRVRTRGYLARPSRSVARLEQPEQVLLARLFQVSLAARGPPLS